MSSFYLANGGIGPVSVSIRSRLNNFVSLLDADVMPKATTTIISDRHLFVTRSTTISNHYFDWPTLFHAFSDIFRRFSLLKLAPSFHHSTMLLFLLRFRCLLHVNKTHISLLLLQRNRKQPLNNLDEEQLIYMSETSHITIKRNILFG